MGDPLKKVQAGQRLEIPAAAYNAFIDAVRADRSRRHDALEEPQRESRSTSIIRVRNSTGGDLDRFSILALQDPIVTPADNLAEFKNRVSFNGVAPNSPVRSPRVAILLEPLAGDAIGRGIVAGVTPVRIDVVRDTDLYAEPIAGTTTHLRSIPNGQTRILWKEAGTGVKWAVVRLSERARFAVFQLAGAWQAAVSPEPDGWMKMTGCRPVFYFGSSHTYAADTSDATETIWHQAGYLFLQNHGFNLTVNVVAWPEQMYLIPAWAEMFRSHGLRFHVDPYSSIAYYPYEYSEAERRFLEPWIWENRRAGLEPVKPDDPITVLCSAGVDHINVQPGGSAWRCILERQLHVNPLGNVFDPGFESLQSPLSCAESWQCPACDRDKVTIIAD